MTLTQIATQDVQQKIGRLCADHGLDARDILLEGLSHEGYFEHNPNAEKEWREWPEDFPVAALLMLRDDLNWLIGRS